MSEANKPYDSSDPKQVKEAKRTRIILEKRVREGFQKICADRDCRYVLGQFLELAGAFRDTYVTNQRDDARNQGWRAAGLWWLSQALLHDVDIVRKLQTDEDSPLNPPKVEQNDRTDDPDLE